MYFWQIGLLAFGVLWGLQIYGTARQMKHYRLTLASISERWSDGFVGSGSARAQFGAGAIAIVVAAPDETVRQVLIMRGRTVFAKFRESPELVGKSVEELRNGAGLPPRLGRAGAAIKFAIDQIDRIRAERAAEQQPMSLATSVHSMA